MSRIHRNAAALFLLAAACSDDPNAPRGALPDRVVVLNGVGQTGVTVVADTGTNRLIRFDPFDGATFALERDSVLSTASSFSGDLLYIAALSSGAVQKVQMPSGSNPGGAAFLPAGTVGVSGASYAVALRNSGQVALVTRVGTSFVTALIGDVGRCPYDVVMVSGVLYSVDANLDCATTYQSHGPVRLIRVTTTSAQRDTITFPGSVVGAPRAFSLGSVVLLFSAGLADFSGTVTVPAAVSRVDLNQRAQLQVAALPAGSFGFQARLANGVMYATAAAGFDAATLRVYALDAGTLAFTGPRATGTSRLALTKTDGTAAACAAATAGADGRFYCVVNSSATATVIVFDATGREVRSTGGGSVAFDIALRE